MSAVVPETELDVVLDRLLSTAREVTGAQYAAIGVLDERRVGLERFLTLGISDAQRRAIGEPPSGHGLLGTVIDDPRPLRSDALDLDSRSYGFPSGHPPMKTFLGVPLTLRGEAWGNLYLCDKVDDEPFTAADEDAVVGLVEWASIAIENARLYLESERRSAKLLRMVRRLEATTAIARAVGGETDLDRILELIVQRGRGLIEARGLVILLRESTGMVVAAEAGEVPDTIRDPLGLAAAGGALVPLVFRGQTLGMLVAFGGRGDGDDDEPLLQAFAASAATAVATGRTVAEQRLHDAMRAAEEERRRWARELHDETLQGLGGLRMLLMATARIDDPERLRGAVRDTVARIEEEIDGLRGLIRELRPAALDELGLEAAIEGLASRATERQHLDVTAAVRVRPVRYPPELETALYRIVQEGLNNALRHAHATSVDLSVDEREGVIRVSVSDDGQGFESDVPEEGFGLTGMRERVALLRGGLEITSSPEGTTIAAAIPAP